MVDSFVRKYADEQGLVPLDFVSLGGDVSLLSSQECRLGSVI